MIATLPQNITLGNPNRNSHQKLRVAVVTETYPPEINGVANTVKHCVDGLIQKGHQVHLIRPRQGKDDLSLKKNLYSEKLVAGLRLPMYKDVRIGLPSLWSLRSEWKKSRPDVLYIATEGPLGLAALLLARKLSIPVVSGYHTNFDYFTRYYKLGFLENLTSRYLRFFHNRSEKTLVPTQELQKKLSEKKIQNTTVFVRGIDISLFKPDRRSHALRNQWNVGRAGLAVIYVGRIAAEKNLQLAEKAFRRIQEYHPDARFILVGDGPSAKAMRARNPDFIFCGMQTGKELARHYASADLFLFPSLSETYGNVVLEAMASGLPVVGFDYAAIAEHVRNDINGFKAGFDLEEDFLLAAEKAVKCKTLKQMGAQSRDSVEAISWEKLHDRFETILLAESKNDQYFAATQ